MYFVNLYTISKVNNNEFTQKPIIGFYSSNEVVLFITSLVMDYLKKSTLL
jgi:hypothetical protein